MDTWGKTGKRLYGYLEGCRKQENKLTHSLGWMTCAILVLTALGVLFAAVAASPVLWGIVAWLVSKIL